jgi:hypothetical protein
MKIIKIQKDCVCVPTKYGKIVFIFCKPLFFLAHNYPKIYKWLFNHILKKWHNYTILIRSTHIFK